MKCNVTLYRVKLKNGECQGHQHWYFHFFQSLFQFCFETFRNNWNVCLSLFCSCFSPFQFFPYIIHCFSVSKHQKWGLVFSLFQSLFQFCFETFQNNWNVWTQSIFFLFQSVSSFSLYNQLFQCFETPEMGPGIFTFSRACFNFVSKHFETTETFGLSQFLSCVSPFQFFPYIIHCFSVSKHQKWGLVFSPFLELVSILFRNISKQLKHLDLVNFCHVSVRFNFFSI